MERLTIDEAIKDFRYCAKQNVADLDIDFAKENNQIADWLEELQGYKATNLTPERMIQIDKDISEQAKELREYKKLSERVDRLWNNNKLIQMLEDKGIANVDEGIKHISELLDAEEQGLLLKLPCKVGDTIYQPTRNFISEFIIESIEISTCNCIFLHTRLKSGINMTGEIFAEDKIGKTVFLTREEAAAKLKEMEGK